MVFSDVVNAVKKYLGDISLSEDLMLADLKEARFIYGVGHYTGPSSNMRKETVLVTGADSVMRFVKTDVERQLLKLVVIHDIVASAEIERNDSELIIKFVEESGITKAILSVLTIKLVG